MATTKQANRKITTANVEVAPHVLEATPTNTAKVRSIRESARDLVAQGLAPLLQMIVAHWIKDGKRWVLEILDGRHRWYALRDLWQAGEITDEQAVACFHVITVDKGQGGMLTAFSLDRQHLESWEIALAFSQLVEENVIPSSYAAIEAGGESAQRTLGHRLYADGSKGAGSAPVARSTFFEARKLMSCTAVWIPFRSVWHEAREKGGSPFQWKRATKLANALTAHAEGKALPKALKGDIDDVIAALAGTDYRSEAEKLQAAWDAFSPSADPAAKPVESSEDGASGSSPVSEDVIAESLRISELSTAVAQDLFWRLAVHLDGPANAVEYLQRRMVESDLDAA